MNDNGRQKNGAWQHWFSVSQDDLKNLKLTEKVGE